MNPNIEYIFKNYNKPFREMMYRYDSTSVLHNDGWLEIRVSMNEKEVANRNRKKLKISIPYTVPIFKNSSAPYAVCFKLSKSII